MKKSREGNLEAQSFAIRCRPELEAEVDRLLAAGAVDEGNGEVFDQLVEAWRGREDAVLQARTAARLELLRAQQQSVIASLAELDEQCAAGQQGVHQLRQELQWASEQLRGVS